MPDRGEQPKSAGIVGDGDELAILGAIEDVFKIAITKEEAASIRTLEDAHAVICSRLPNDRSEQTRCLTSMAYYRLTRAMQRGGKISLKKRVEMPAATTPREFQKQLEKASGLKLPFLTTPSTWVNIIGWFMLGTWMTGPVLFSGFHATAVSILLFAGNFAVWRVATRLDRRVWAFSGTVADLSRQASEENIGQLVCEGGKWQKADIWAAMTKIIADETGFPAEDMRPAMAFID